MRKILALEEGPGFGGALISLKYLLESADEDNFFYLISNYQQQYIQPHNNIKDVTVITRKRIYGKNSPLEKILRVIVGRKAGPAAYILDRVTYCNQYVNHLVKYINKNKIDIVHLNNWPLLNDGGLFAAKKAGVPVVMHIRGMEYSSRLIGWLVNQADHVIAISDYIKNLICQLGIEANKISVIPNAVDVDNFVRSAKESNPFRDEIGIDHKCKLIGMAGCLVDWKGHKIFLSACADVFKETPAHGLVIGDTPNGAPAYKIELQNYAKTLGISDRIHFVGHRRDIASAMDACDVMVHASTAPEPFGRVIIEAMALGKPVVATAPGGPQEIIQDQVDGLLVPPSDPIAISKAIARYLYDNNFRREIERRAKEKVLERYNVQKYVDKVTSVYEKILS